MGVREILQNSYLRFIPTQSADFFSLFLLLNIDLFFEIEERKKKHNLMRKCYNLCFGATTFSIKTLSITRFSITTLGIMTFSIKTLSITTLSINALDTECFYAEFQLC